jgi:hypothetical protein
MDIVLAVEVMRVLLFVLHTLNLDSRVEKTILSATEVSNCGKCLQWLT